MSFPSPSLDELFTEPNLRHPLPGFEAKILDLLKSGADPNRLTLDSRGEASSPLLVAIEFGSMGWVEILLKHGAEVNPDADRVCADRELLETNDRESNRAPVEEDCPSSPFSPLGRAVRGVIYALEDEREGLADLSGGMVGIACRLLAAGADLLAFDPFTFRTPWQEWIEDLGAALFRDAALWSEPIPHTVVAAAVHVTEALVAALPSDLAEGLSTAVRTGIPDERFPEAATILSWPEVSEVWRARLKERHLSVCLPDNKQGAARPLRL